MYYYDEGFNNYDGYDVACRPSDWWPGLILSTYTPRGRYFWQHFDHRTSLIGQEIFNQLDAILQLFYEHLLHVGQLTSYHVIQMAHQVTQIILD